jgi:hypothetical protein
MFVSSWPPFVCRRDHVFITLFVFAYAWVVSKSLPPFVCRRDPLLLYLFLLHDPSYKRMGVKTKRTYILRANRSGHHNTKLRTYTHLIGQKHYTIEKKTLYTKQHNKTWSLLQISYQNNTIRHDISYTYHNKTDIMSYCGFLVR